MRSILIAGCGYVGTELGRRLALAGFRVWGLRRSPTSFPAGVQPLLADLVEPESIRALPSVDTVFYTVSAGGRGEVGYRSAYVDGARNVLAALSKQRHRVTRFFFVSSTAVYAQEGGEWVNEESPTDAASPNAQFLLEGERLSLQGPFPATVVRFAGIYGPGRSRLLERIRRGEAVCVDGAPVYANRIHRDDCAGILQHLLYVKEPDAVYLGVDYEPADACCAMNWLAARMGVAPPPVVPLAEPGDRKRRSTKRCSNERIAATGYTFEYPTFREGYGSLVSQLPRLEN